MLLISFEIIFIDFEIYSKMVKFYNLFFLTVLKLLNYYTLTILQMYCVQIKYVYTIVMYKKKQSKPLEKSSIFVK